MNLRDLIVRSGGERLRVRVLDLAEGGARLEGESELPVGEEITLQFGPQGEPAPLRVRARIERWAEVGRGETPAHRGGVSFQANGTGHQAALRELVDRVRRAGVE